MRLSSFPSGKGNYMNPEQLEHIFYDLKSLVSKLEASDKSAHKRIDRIEGNIDAIHTLALSVQQIATETKNMREDLDGAIKKLTELETKPVRKWDNLIHYILSAIIGAAVAYFFAKL